MNETTERDDQGQASDASRRPEWELPQHGPALPSPDETQEGDRPSDEGRGTVPSPEQAPVTGALDLRDNRGALDSRAAAREVAGPDAPRAEETQATLASLAFRLFSTIENQMARDPHAATLSVLAARVDSLERQLIGARAQLDQVSRISERLVEIDAKLSVPDPHATAISQLADRVEATEHRLASPHPHTATISSLAERMDAVESADTPRQLAAVGERLEVVERHVTPPAVVNQLADRVGDLERRLSASDSIAGLTDRLDEYESRLETLEHPPEPARRRRSWPLALALLLVVAAVIAALVVVFVL